MKHHLKSWNKYNINLNLTEAKFGKASFWKQLLFQDTFQFLIINKKTWKYEKTFRQDYFSVSPGM